MPWTVGSGLGYAPCTARWTTDAPLRANDPRDRTMGKALLGTHATPSTLRLLDEVQALRRRVAELEQALAAAEAVRAQLPAEALVGDGPIPAEGREHASA